MFESNLDKAVRLYTESVYGYIGHWWALAGRRNVKARQAILSALHGRKVPQSKSGINAMAVDMETAFGLDATGLCVAEREERLMHAIAERAHAMGLELSGTCREWVAA